MTSEPSWMRLTKRAHVNRQLAFRARLVLACADGTLEYRGGAPLSHDEHTVGKWRTRFIASRLDGLYDEPRVGAPRTISDDAVEAVIVKTLETTPPGRDALEHADDGGEGRDESHDGRPDLADVRPQAAPSPSRSSCRRTRNSSTRCGTSSGCT